ncbi:MAG: hypothetical protein EAZ85_13315 [Bacteroidetes bacterium]|nr:MAG: hypothetical protein EAZ85_13315 [Bacteroidota bacterium]TAG87776.1 MAG: hypothetical protein EAZ20_09935 [Bacteroidota bacterium]
MNTQKKAILYDDNCPMCRLYTQGFVKAGMLESENRIPFSCVQESPHANKIDLDRSRHEIPLIDLEGGKTLYGLDSLLFMIGSRLPFLASIGRFAPFYYFFKLFYAFISYNRRVIIQSVGTQKGFNCAPDFNVYYRLSFIGIALFLGGYFFQIRWEYILGVVISHYLLPFLNKYERSELLGQLSVSIFIGLIFLPFHFWVGISAFLLAYIWRIKTHFKL